MGLGDPASPACSLGKTTPTGPRGRGTSGTLLGSARQEGWHEAPTAVAASSGPVNGRLAHSCPEKKGHSLLRVLGYQAMHTYVFSASAQCPPGVMSDCCPLYLGR